MNYVVPIAATEAHAMVILDVRVVVKPDQRERWFELLDALVPPSRAEPACHRYEVYESTETPNTFLFFEEWATIDDFYTHNHTPHVSAFFAGLADVLEAPPDGTISHVTFSVPLDAALESAGIGDETARAFGTA